MVDFTGPTKHEGCSKCLFLSTLMFLSSTERRQSAVLFELAELLTELLHRTVCSHSHVGVRLKGKAAAEHIQL